MAYIDATFLNSAFGTTNVTALCGSAGEVSTVVGLAEAAVYAALWNAGYQTDSAPADFTTATVPKTVQLLAYVTWIELAHLRKSKPTPEALTRNLPKIADLDPDEAGRVRMEIPELTKSTTRAIGGVSTTDVTSDRVDGGRPAVFGPDKMTGYG